MTTSMFQFTHPVWGATPAPNIDGITLNGFNSRTPCGVRLLRFPLRPRPFRFNSRTPCGVRLYLCRITNYIAMFQFTHPVWGATEIDPRVCREVHSFNSRTPCGVRHLGWLGQSVHTLWFQFTHPVWGATPPYNVDYGEAQVSIHAPRVGCDRPTARRATRRRTFQFTHPVWGATDSPWSLIAGIMFQFTHPVWGATNTDSSSSPSVPFQFTHPVWGATQRHAIS